MVVDNNNNKDEVMMITSVLVCLFVYLFIYLPTTT